MKVEGRNAVYELLKTDKEIDKILVQKDLKDDASKRLINVIKSHKVKLQPVDKYVIEKESESKRHQGFIAYVSDYKYFDIDDIIDDNEGCDQKNDKHGERDYPVSLHLCHRTAAAKTRGAFIYCLAVCHLYFLLTRT